MFAQLLRCSGVEERVTYGSSIGFLALHGGLEPGTEGVAATAAAAAGASSYIVTQPRTLGWHVPSHRIVTDEVPGLAGFLEHVDIVISVHGYFRPEWPDAVYVGGANRLLAGRLARRLRTALPDLEVVDDLQAIPRGLRGVDPRNPVNGSRGGGVQLELPHRARTASAIGTAGAVAARLTGALGAFAVDVSAWLMGRDGGGRLGVIGGHSVLGFALADARGRPAHPRPIAVRGGPIDVVDAADTVFLQRHGSARYTPAHRLDHHAHAHALARVGVDRVLAISSVGSLRAEYPVGTVLVPDDFVGLGGERDSRFADERGHTVPGFDAAWRTQVLDAWRQHADAEVVDGATYWQVTGPRFETPAEVRFLAAFADVVGMTVASECVAMAERDIAYAAVCIVDNLANGIGDTVLTVEEFEAGKAANRAALLATLAGTLPALAA